MLKASRKNARKVIFLLTDGFSNDGDPTKIAKELRDNGTHIYTFGIKDSNHKVGYIHIMIYL